MRAAKGVAIAGIVGCTTLAAGAIMLAAAFGVLSMRGARPAPAAPATPPAEVEPTAGTLAVGGLAFGGGTGAGPLLAREQPLPFRFELSGLSTGNDGEWGFVADIQVEAPPGVRVVEGKLLQERGSGPQPIPVAGKVELASWSPPGTYTVTLKVEDLVSKSELEVEQAIEVR